MTLFSDALWMGGEDQLPKALSLEPFPASSHQLLWLFRPEQDVGPPDPVPGSLPCPVPQA